MGEKFPRRPIPLHVHSLIRDAGGHTRNKIEEYQANYVRRIKPMLQSLTRRLEYSGLFPTILVTDNTQGVRKVPLLHIATEEHFERNKGDEGVRHVYLDPQGDMYTIDEDEIEFDGEGVFLLESLRSVTHIQYITHTQSALQAIAQAAREGLEKFLGLPQST